MRYAALLLLIAALGASAETIEVNPPRSVCATVSRVTLDGGAQYDTVTRDWVIVVNIEITPPALPTVSGVEMEPLPPMTRRAVVTAKRAEIEAVAGKANLTEAELSAAVRGVVLGKLQSLLSGIGG